MRLTGTLTCRSEQDLSRVLAHVDDHIRLSRAEPGCLSFAITRTVDPMVWQVDESFVDQAAFEAHQARTRASEWYRQTAELPRAFQILPG